MRLFLSLDNPKNAQINDETEAFGADEADSLVSCFFNWSLMLLSSVMKLFYQWFEASKYSQWSERGWKSPLQKGTAI